MKISNIANTSFKSNVKIMDTLCGKPEDRFNNTEIAAIKRALKKLENNGNNDTVKIFLKPNDSDNIYLKVQQNKGNRVLEGAISLNLFYQDLSTQDIINAYNTASIVASKTKPVRKSTFSKYI